MITRIFNRTIQILLVLAVAAFAQQKTFLKQTVQEKISSEESYPVDVRPYLERFNKANGIDEVQLAKENVLTKTNKTAWNFVVGSQKNWWAANWVSNTFYTTPSTCRAVGNTCYIFVEDSLWNSRVDQNAVDQVKNAFDSATPANPNKGIYQTDIETFGNPPNIDFDSKIIIFILNIRDGYNGTGGYVAGYFTGLNESLTHSNSNQAEIYYLDANPLNLKSSGGITTGMKTTAHEFQHMIHWNYIAGDETFFNEGWSLAAEVINGYSLYSQSGFLGESNHYLLDWRRDDNTAVLKDYSRAARFSLYLKEQFGTAIFKNYLSNRISGVQGVNLYMASVGSRTFSSVLIDWWLANFLNENVGNSHPEWIYTYTPITKVASNVTYSNPNITNGTTNGVYKYSAEYITFNSGKNLKINFNTAVNQMIKIKAIKAGTTKVVNDVTPGTDYSVPDFGTTYSSVTFMVYHNNGNDGQTGPFVYSFTSTGNAVNTVQEIAYDTSEPTGVYPWSVGDTMAVKFDGIVGMKLDSIRVALRNTVPMEGGVWRAATSGSSHLGSRLAGPFNVIGKTTPGTPYPSPWPNWITYDLRSLNIDASSNFVVAFPVKGKYAGATGAYNNLMVTSKKGTSAYHSYTYLISLDASPQPAGWYYISDSDTTIALYLIRAYVSSGPVGVNEPIELLPSTFSLEQNYPNPFNPSTEISWQLAVGSMVTLKIYDILGREVATLVNEFQQAGKYVKTFHETSLPSGVYFYRLVAGNKTETKKMLLMK